MSATPRIDDYGRLITFGNGMGGKPVVPPLIDYGMGRSGKWSKLLHSFLDRFPKCMGCERDSDTAHHIRPYHLYPELELDENNLVAVCVPCHFVICHLGDWRLWTADPKRALLDHWRYVQDAKKFCK